MNLGVFPALQFFAIVWEGKVYVLFGMFSGIPHWNCPALDFCLRGKFFITESISLPLISRFKLFILDSILVDFVYRNLYIFSRLSSLLACNFLSVQFSSVAQSCPTLCNPMNCSTPGLPVHQQLLEFTQTHVHQVGDAIQPSHRLSSPFSPAPNPSQHQSLFQWVNSSHEVAKVLECQL